MKRSDRLRDAGPLLQAAQRAAPTRLQRAAQGELLALAQGPRHPVVALVMLRVMSRD